MMLSISRKRLIAFIVTEVIKSKQEFGARLIDIELAKNNGLLDRYLNDESEYNGFKSHFRIRSIDCLVSYSNILTIYPHSFDLKLLLKFKLAL